MLAKQVSESYVRSNIFCPTIPSLHPLSMRSCISSLSARFKTVYVVIPSES